MNPTIEISEGRRGPKEKYKPEFCDIIVEIARQGGHIPAMMMAMDVRSKETWYRWQKEHPDFKDAVDYAHIVSQAFHEKIGLDAMQGKIKNFQSTVYVVTMANKFGHDYKRNPSGTEITINNNTVNLTSEQIQQKIAQKIEKLKSLGQDIIIEQSQ